MRFGNAGRPAETLWALRSSDAGSAALEARRPGRSPARNKVKKGLRFGV